MVMIQQKFEPDSEKEFFKQKYWKLLFSPTAVCLSLPSVCVFLSRFLSLQGSYVVVYKYWPWHLLGALVAHGTGLCYWTPW